MTQQSSQPASRRPPAALLAVVIGIAAYSVVFYLTEMPSISDSRAALVFHSVVLVDQVIAEWFGDPPEFSLLDRLPILFYATVIFAFAGVLGRLLLALVQADRRLSPVERFVFSSGVGLGGLSLYVLSVGLAGLLHNPLVWWLPAAVILIWAAWRWRRMPVATPLDANGDRGSDWLDRRWLWLAAPFAVLILLGGMLPPVEFDVREYHLQATKEFYRAGQITFLPHNIYANMPLGAEMLSLLGMVLARDWWTGALVGKTLIAMFAPLTALALLAAGIRFFSPTTGRIAAIVYLSTPWIGRVSNLGLIEGPLGFYLFAAVYAVLLWHDARDPNERSAQPMPLLLLAGFMAGTAAAFKYPAVLFVVAPLAGWVFLSRGRPDVRSLGVFLLAASLACGLWFGKNFVLTGNPVYPLLYNIFGGTSRTPENDAQWRRAHRPASFSAGNAVAHLSNVAWRSEWHSPLLIPLAVLAWWGAGALHRQSAEKRLVGALWAYFALVIVAWWLLTHRIDRFWAPAIPVVALLAGVGAGWCDRVVWRRILLTWMILCLVGNFFVMARPTGGYHRFFVGYARLRDSAERVNPWHLWLNRRVPAGHAVLAVGEAQVFDLEMPVYYSTVFDACLLEQWLEGRTPQAFHNELLERNISHVFVHWGEIARYRSPGNYGFSDFVQPKVFRRLVEAGVLAPPEPPIENNPGQVFRVVPSPK